MLSAPKKPSKMVLICLAVLTGCGESVVHGEDDALDRIRDEVIPWEVLQGRLVVTTPSGSEVLLLHAPERNVQTVASGLTGASAFALSPDGRRLAFAHFDLNSGTGTDLRELPVGSAAVICPPRRCGEPLVVTEGFEWGPAWSDDGALAYVANRGGDGGVYLDEVRIHPEELYSAGLVRPDWAPDGTVIAALFRAGGRGLYRLEPESGNAVALIEDIGQITPTAGDWTVSPDGTRLAFTRYGFTNGEETIWVSDIDGENARQLASGARPIWSPDGTRLAFATRDESAGGVRTPVLLVDVEGGTPIRILEDATLWDWR